MGWDFSTDSDAFRWVGIGAHCLNWNSWPIPGRWHSLLAHCGHKLFKRLAALSVHGCVSGKWPLQDRRSNPVAPAATWPANDLVAIFVPCNLHPKVGNKSIAPVDFAAPRHNAKQLRKVPNKKNWVVNRSRVKCHRSCISGKQRNFICPGTRNVPKYATLFSHCLF